MKCCRKTRYYEDWTTEIVGPNTGYIFFQWDLFPMGRQCKEHGFKSVNYYLPEKSGEKKMKRGKEAWSYRYIKI